MSPSKKSKPSGVTRVTAIHQQAACVITQGGVLSLSSWVPGRSRHLPAIGEDLGGCSTLGDRESYRVAAGNQRSMRSHGQPLA